MGDSVAERGDERKHERRQHEGEPSDAEPSTPDAAADANAGANAGAFAELRTLIVGPERRELEAVRAHLADPAVRAREVGRVLPEAIALRAGDAQLTRALTPPVEEAITASVRRDPRPLADALFPAIGPAIRKAIVHTLAAMMESLNRTVEQSLSWRAVQWRWTALRTGKPFAEIVFLNTLHYRVEQVFLIHRESGLVLQHVSSDLANAEDPDQVSAMLTAIRDFARDSFHVGSEDGLEALRMGDLVVIVEQGPHAIVAGVVRGTPPYTLRTMFQQALESVHMQLGAELEAFRGESEPFERARPTLEACLVTQFRQPSRRRTYRRWALAGGLVAVAIGAWAFLSIRERQRFNDYLERLRAEPGIVVLASGRRGGRFVVSGLRDPLANDPRRLLAATGLAPDAVDGRWEGYQALHPAFVAARARDLLRPPPDVTLAYRDGVLTASGPASERWVAESARLSPAIAGVRRFEYAGTPPDIRLKQGLESLSLRFVKGQSRLAAGQDDALRSLADMLESLDAVVRDRGARAGVEVLGHTDSDGSEQVNGPLSRARADAVLSLLRTHAFEALDISTRGVGSSLPLTPGANEQDKERNRRASFRVRLAAESGARGPGR